MPFAFTQLYVADEPNLLRTSWWMGCRNIWRVFIHTNRGSSCTAEGSSKRRFSTTTSKQKGKRAKRNVFPLVSSNPLNRSFGLKKQWLQWWVSGMSLS